ncbi:MAG: hypothetical protein PHH17_00540 [Candidatus Pacebacteria bacterium]|jgi:hypothetical protein|nr:hypothetical protein [Candidatus Paceibacterota bacterium]MDD3072187.1 hypothetical protein [Candidatus Paceibacterota bacterium]MDD3728748.1 hypothetical protein [Candidatus Paceibacterota bacterium]MDD4201393.1 hypothetical protein [Candidatus Paceibacterota bacterium]MDD4466833.1 hypothetical protein [Candidatus Paceibacterota bacterium]
MKEKVPTILAIVIIILFFVGTVAIIVYQYLKLESENKNFETSIIEKEFIKGNFKGNENLDQIEDK